MPGKLEQLRERYANQDDAAEPLFEAPQPIDTGLCVRCSHTRDEHRLGPGGALSPTPGRCRRREQATKSGAWRACTCPAYQDPVVGVVKNSGAETTRERETYKCGSCLGRGKVKVSTAVGLARAFAGMTGETTFIKCGDCKGRGRVPID